MKIRALELEQFRKFEQPTRLSGFSDGLNLLCGPNEFGKSTILAAIRAVLFERFASRADSVRRMQNWRGNAAPRLAMEFERGGGLWRIEKRFLSQPMARLTDPAGAVFDGDAAEEKLQSLLGFGSAARKGTEHHGVWAALWVTQRQSAEQADFSTDLARATIASCLDAEVGVLTGAERGHAVRKAAEAQLARLLDGNGRPKDRYKAVLAEIAALDKILADLRARAVRLHEDADALRQQQAVLAKLDDPEAARDLTEKLQDARRRRDAAQLLTQRRVAAHAEWEKAKAEEAAALRETAARAARADALATLAQSLEKTAQAARAARQDATGAALHLDRIRAGVAGADTRLTEAATALRAQRETAALVAQSANLHAAETALETVRPVQAEIEKTLAALSCIAIDKPAIDAIRKAAREHDIAEAALASQATAIEIETEPDAVVILDGATLPNGRTTHRAVTETAIAIPGQVRIRIRPAMQDKEKILARTKNAAQALRENLARAQCATPAEAENLWSRRDSLEAEHQTAQLALARLAPGDAATGLAPGLAPLQERVGVLRLAVQDALARLGLAQIPERHAAENALHLATQAEHEATLALTEARAAQEQAMQADKRQSETAIRAEAAATAARTEHARLEQEKTRAEAQETATALAARLDAAASAAATHAETLRRLEAEAGADTVEAMDLRIARYETGQRQRTDDQRKLREKIVELRTRIAAEGGAGLDEQIAAAERTHAERTAERDAAARETEILRLLIETLAAAERETKQRYLAPVTGRVTPYLRRLFPGATIECDDSLKITGIARNGAPLADFERLSDGTQEQIAVLARLAFAELLLDQGKPAMVILDDALAWSDDERIERMFDILSQAAKRMQILVLSCRQDVFGRAGGTRVAME